MHVTLMSLLEDHLQTANLSVSDSRKAEFRSATESDVSLQHVKKLTNEGWPANLNIVPESARPFWKVRDKLHVTDGLVFAGKQLVVPQTMNKVALQVTHEGHMGIEKCKQQASACLYWPSMNADIENLVNDCEVCNKFSSTIHKEPMIPHEVPSRPWEKVGVDYFIVHNKDFPLIVDYYSISRSNFNGFQDCSSNDQGYARGILKAWNTQHCNRRQYAI